ncbi:MAG: hypothetical protein ABIV48_13210, partial [Pyrinomonadaceae bacterium]
MPHDEILEEYQQITYADATARLAARFKGEYSPLPSLDNIKSRRAFDRGDHWQNGDGFIGQLPTGEEADVRKEMLRKAFSPEDVVSEVLDTHIENVLDDDPIISIQNDDDTAEDAATLEIIKEWFDKRNNTQVLADALRGARRDSASVLRAFIPAGMIHGEGRINARDLREALSKIWIRAEHIENGGVIIDEATATELGLFQYRMKVQKTEISLCEYAYLIDDNTTIWGTAS